MRQLSARRFRAAPFGCGLFGRGLFGAGSAVAGLALLGAGAAVAQDALWNPARYGATRPTLNFYGLTGLIDMPSAESQPDGQVSVTVGSFAGITRGTLSFQIMPRVTGSFRYAGLQDWNFGGFDTYYDRSFDLRFQVLEESRYIPAVAVGLQDMFGTGLYSGEYIVATKHLTPELKVTGGLGWGRLGSSGSIGSPFGPRPKIVIGSGGQPTTDVWFRGPAAPFGGIEWQPDDRWTLKAEYSSDAYDLEDGKRGIFNRRSPWNFGAEYQLNRAVRLGAYYMYGSEVGITASISTNPHVSPTGGSTGRAPAAVVLRPDPRRDPAAWDTDWTAQADGPQLLRANLARLMTPEGLILEALTVRPHWAEIRFRNTRYRSPAQALGRAARAMTAVLPASVETFVLVPVVNGLPASAVTLSRSDIETLENAPEGAEVMFARARIEDAPPLPADAVYAEGLYPRFTWAVGPYARPSYFDPGNPFRLDVGLRARARYEIAPGLIASGSVRKKIAGNLDQVTRKSNSVLPRVRTDGALYDKKGDPALETLTLAKYFRPGPNLYGRVTAGYLESMFGGVSAEVLWKPVDSRLAFGVEANYVKQRDYDMLFGFRNYSVATGHVSAYYDLGNGFQAQVDAGRYLAGDWGATFGLDREFANGWKLGAFFTLTDVSAADFGEGSFDKGIRISIPFSWLIGQDNRSGFGTTLRPITRDGGARLSVDGRLYPLVREYHTRDLYEQRGRFWR
jgi:hypothetical protein